jgi:hypothetical protein
MLLGIDSGRLGSDRDGESIRGDCPVELSQCTVDDPQVSQSGRELRVRGAEQTQGHFDGGLCEAQSLR